MIPHFSSQLDNNSWASICEFLSTLSEPDQKCLLQAENWGWGAFHDRNDKKCLIGHLPLCYRQGSLWIKSSRYAGAYDDLCRVYSVDRIVALIKQFLMGLK